MTPKGPRARDVRFRPRRARNSKHQTQPAGQQNQRNVNKHCKKTGKMTMCEVRNLRGRPVGFVLRGQKNLLRDQWHCYAATNTVTRQNKHCYAAKQTVARQQKLIRGHKHCYAHKPPLSIGNWLNLSSSDLDAHTCSRHEVGMCFHGRGHAPPRMPWRVLFHVLRTALCLQETTRIQSDLQSISGSRTSSNTNGEMPHI